MFLRKKTKKPFLDPSEFQPVPLVEKTLITHNTVRLRFALPDPEQRVGLPIGQHISFKAQGEDGKDVIRPYTPVSDDDQLGAVDFVIKLYPTGKMSQVRYRAGCTVWEPSWLRAARNARRYAFMGLPGATLLGAICGAHALPLPRPFHSPPPASHAAPHRLAPAAHVRLCHSPSPGDRQDAAG